MAWKGWKVVGYAASTLAGPLGPATLAVYNRERDREEALEKAEQNAQREKEAREKAEREVQRLKKDLDDEKEKCKLQCEKLLELYKKLDLIQAQKESLDLAMVELKINLRAAESREGVHSAYTTFKKKCDEATSSW